MATEKICISGLEEGARIESRILEERFKKRLPMEPASLK